MPPHGVYRVPVDFKFQAKSKALLLMVCLFLSPKASSSCEEHLYKSGDRTAIRWRRVDLGSAFRALQDAGIPLNFNGIRYNVRAGEILSQILKTDVSPIRFIYGVRKRYGSWDEGLRQNGIDPRFTREQFPTELPEDLILLAIQRLAAAGEPLSADLLNRRKGSARADQILLETLGMPISQQGFYIRGSAHFGSWPLALKQAGLNPAQVLQGVPKGDLSRDLIIRILESLWSVLDGDLRATNVRQQRNRVKLALYAEFQIIVSEVSLFAATKNEFGSWERAVEAADLPNRYHRRKQLFWTRPFLNDVLQKLSPHLDMTLKQFKKNYRDVKRFTEEIYGYPIAAGEIYKAAKHLYGGWSSALKAANRVGKESPTAPDETPFSAETLGLEGVQRQIAEIALQYLREHGELPVASRLVDFVRAKSGRDCDWTDISRALRLLADRLEIWEPQ
jgi:hypothetical protein